MLALLPLLSGHALAGSIAASGVVGGPDAGAATPSPVAIHYNPAAIAAAPGVQVLADAQMAFIRVDVRADRNAGIDPNTGEEYTLAKARVQVPVFLVGATWQAIPDRLTVGFAVSDPFVGGGNYLAGEPDEEPPYESHQRYSGVMTKVVTIHMTPAVAVTVWDGVHVGGSFKYVLDSFEAIQASDPLHTEGYMEAFGPYSTDTVLQGELSGSHIGYSAGVFFDAVQQAQVGISYTNNGRIQTEGEGEVILPELLGGGEQQAKLTFETPLPPVVQTYVRSQVTEDLTLGAGFEVQMWGACCSTHDGDNVIGVTDPDGNALVSSAGEIKTVQYSPKRLQNSTNLHALAGWQARERLWLGARLMYSENAVPDYAVSATNIDYQSVGGYIGARATLGPLTVGLNYAKYFPFERLITNSAWDAEEGSSDYVDEYFSPSLPYKANTNGLYQAKVDLVGVRVSASF